MTTEVKKKATPTQCLTPKFRVSYPNVFQARAAVEGQEPKFSISMLFPKVFTDPEDKLAWERMRAAVAAAIVEKWGSDKTVWPKNLRLPFRDGGEEDKKDKDGYGPNVIFVNATSKTRPGLIDAQTREKIIDPNGFYGGCYGVAALNAYAYDVSGNKGVSFGLNNLMKMGDGEPFGNRKSAEEDFAAIKAPAGVPAGAAAGGVDPLAGLDIL